MIDRINWPAFDTILLDMDGTLLDLNYDNHFWLEHLPTHYATQQGVSTEEARTQLLKRINTLRGTLDWYCLDYWSDQLKLDVSNLKRDTVHLIKERPHTLSFLKWLAENNKQRVLVTNSHQAGVTLKFEHSSIGEHLDYVYTSHQFGEPKESISFWKKFYDAHPFDKSRALLIDDNEHVLETAGEFGIKGLYNIAQPDLAKPARSKSKFPLINCFSEHI